MIGVRPASGSQFAYVDFSDLQKGLNEMALDMQTKAGYRAASAGARVVQRKAIANAKSVPSGKKPGLVDTGALVKNIAIARRPVGNGGSYFPYHIGVRHGTKKQIKTGNDPWYWWLLEFGFTDRGGQRHKFPFLVPAIASSNQAALEAIRRSLQSSLKRFQNRSTKGGGKQ